MLNLWIHLKIQRSKQGHFKYKGQSKVISNIKVKKIISVSLLLSLSKVGLSMMKV